MIIIWAAAVLSFFAVFSILLAVYFSPAAQRRSLSQRIQNLTQSSSAQERRTKEPRSYKTLLRNLSRTIAPKGLAARFESDLIKAGILLKGEEAVTLWLLLLVVPAAAVLILGRDIVAALLVMAIACAVPFFLLKSATAKRIARFDSQISDALVIMANSMRAGFSFLQALEMVGKEMEDPMSSEVRRVLREMQLGVPTEKALTNMGERVGSEDFDLVITAILIQRQVGGNLAEVLTNISSTIRGRIQLGREVKVLTAQGKMSGLVIGILPIILCILLYFINKEYILLLFTDPRGLLLLGAGIALQIFGLLVIKRIVDIQM
jgi:tight adherence protein B